MTSTIHPNHKAFLDDILADAEDATSKKYLRIALASHLYTAFKAITRVEARRVVSLYFKQKEN